MTTVQFKTTATENDLNQAEYRQTTRQINTTSAYKGKQY